MAITPKSFCLILISIFLATGCEDYREKDYRDLSVTVINESSKKNHISLKQNNQELEYLTITKVSHSASNGACIIDVNAPLTLDINAKKINFRLYKDKIPGWFFCAVKITIFDNFFICEQFFHDKEPDNLKDEELAEWMNTVKHKTFAQKIQY